MACEGVTPLDFASAGLFETFGGASVCLDLWHSDLLDENYLSTNYVVINQVVLKLNFI